MFYKSGSYEVRSRKSAYGINDIHQLAKWLTTISTLHVNNFMMNPYQEYKL